MTPDSQDTSKRPIRVRCPGCDKAFGAPVKLAGRRTACPACGERFTIPQPSRPLADGARPEERVVVECFLCELEMKVPVSYVGRRVKCPDCDTLTVVPPPIDESALASGDGQYEVYEGEDQPWGTELAARQQKQLTFKCKLCDSVLTVAASRVGESIDCPDCGVANPVVEPKVIETSRWVEGDDVADFEVEAPSVSPDESIHTSLYEGAENAPLGYRNREDGRSMVGHGQEDAPRSAMVRGVMTFWWSTGALVSLVVIGGLPIAWGAVLAFGIESMRGLGGMGLILGAATLAMAGAMFLLWLVVTATLCISILIASADGNAKVPEWPGRDPSDWFAVAPRASFAILMAAIPGVYAAMHYATDHNERVVYVLVSLWALLPWTLLSQLESDSMLLVFSPRLAMSLAWAPLSWTVYYTWTFVMLAAAWYLDLKTYEWIADKQVLITGPVYAFVFMTASRLLGRLAWVISSRAPEVEEA